MKLFTLALLAASVAHADAARDAQWREDLDTLATELPKRHPNLFFQTPRAVFDQAVADLRDAIPSMNDAEIMVGFARVAALPRDAHTNIGLAQRNAAFRLLPLALRWFDDGLFVVGTGDGYRPAAGARILRIGGAAVEDAYAAVRELISYENDSWARELSSGYLVNNDVLAALKLTPDNLSARFQFQTLAGETFEMDIASSTPNIPAAVTLYPDPAAGYTPLWQRQRGTNYWFTYLESSRTLYFAYNSCAEMATLPFATFNAQFWAVFDAKPVDRVVIDLRNNTGGNSAVLAPYITSGMARTGRFADTRAYVLIGRRSFSSAVLNAVQLHQGPVALVGEPSGGNPIAYGEVLSFVLPNSRLTVNYSTRMMYAPAGVQPGPLIPDISVRMTSADYFARHDPVLAAALADAGPAAPSAAGPVTVVNAATFRLGPVAPGSLVAAFGPWTANAVGLFVNSAAAPVLAVSPGQVNFRIPPETPPGPATIRVVENGAIAASGVFDVAAAAPGLFVLDAAAPARPAAAIIGGGVLQLYGTGQGDGSLPARVYIGAELAMVTYSGPQPSFPGLWQINVELSDGISGEMPVFVAVGAAVSNGVTVRFGK